MLAWNRRRTEESEISSNRYGNKAWLAWCMNVNHNQTGVNFCVLTMDLFAQDYGKFVSTISRNLVIGMTPNLLAAGGFSKKNITLLMTSSCLVSCFLMFLWQYWHSIKDIANNFVIVYFSIFQSYADFLYLLLDCIAVQFDGDIQVFGHRQGKPTST